MILGKFKAVTVDPASLCIKRMSMVFILWGKKLLFLLIVFSLSLFLWLYCLPAAEGPLWCLLWCHGLLCRTVEPMVFLSNRSWHTGWKKKKIKLFYNYGYLIESAFVTAAEVLETGVCKYLYIFWFVFNLRDVCACFCSSPLATHASRLAYLHAEWLLPWEDTGLRVTWIACVVQPTPRSLVSL